MKHHSKIRVVGIAACLLALSASAQLPSRPFLQGKWEGVMTITSPQADGSPAIAPPFQGQQLGLRLDIGQTNLVLQFQSGVDWIPDPPFGEGQDLRLNPSEGRSAIVIAALPAGADGSLIESMMLNIVRWDEDTIVVHMSRITGADPATGAPPRVVNLMGRFNRGDW